MPEPFDDISASLAEAFGQTTDQAAAALGRALTVDLSHLSQFGVHLPRQPLWVRVARRFAPHWYALRIQRAVLEQLDTITATQGATE